MTPEEQQAADAARAAEEAKAAEAKATEAKAAEDAKAAEAAAAAAAALPAGGEKPIPAGEADAAKRYSELTARTKAAEKAAAEAQERERLALEALQRLGRPAPTPQPGEVEPVEPQAPEWDGDPQTYQEAMAKYARDLSTFAASKAAKAAVAEESAKREKQSQAQTESQRRAEWDKRRAAAITSMPDYEVVAENPNLPISPAMAQAITGDPEGAAVAYHLGQNVDEAARIAALPPGQQLIEFGAIKARLVAARSTKTITKTPPPPGKPVGSGASGAGSGAEPSMDEYAAKRNETIAAEKRRPGAR